MLLNPHTPEGSGNNRHCCFHANQVYFVELSISYVIPLFPTVHFRSLNVPNIRSQEAEIWTGGVTKDDKMCIERSKRTNTCSRYLPDGGYNEVFEWQRYIILLRRRAINTRVRSRCEEMTFLLALYFCFLLADQRLSPADLCSGADGGNSNSCVFLLPLF